MTASAWTFPAGGFFIVGFEGTSPSEEILSLIADHGIGGVILYGRNCGPAEEVARLTESLQTAASRAGRTDPLLIAIDQEGGDVVRIREGATVFPGAAELASLGDIETVRQVSRAVSRELLVMGINWNLAPVADLPVSKNCPLLRRSFGGDAVRASGFVRAWIQGAEEAGMASCLKHFPGHGGVCEDSHVAAPFDRREAQEIMARDLLPFHAGIAAGAPAVMTAHVSFPCLDDTEPATFSSALIEGLLRGYLSYDGLLVSDDLEMAGAADRYGLADASVRALAAGVDLLIVSGMILPERDLPQLMGEVAARLAGGEVPPERLGKAAGRIRHLGRRLAGRRPGMEVLRCREHLDLLDDIERRLRG